MNEQEQKEYKNYLESQGISAGEKGRNYITMLNDVKEYAQWLSKKGLEIHESTYKHLMDHVGYLQKKGKGIHRVNHALRSISHYYNYKGWENIAQTTRMRGVPKTQPQGLLTEEELQEIYESYFPDPHKNNYHHTDKLIIGLVIYQALDMSEFSSLEVGDLQLNKGRVYLRAGKSKKARYVPLHANQVLILDKYLREIRPQYANKTSDKLFSPNADKYGLLHYQFRCLSIKMKAHVKEEMNMTLHKINQLRQSRIAIWVREEGLRKAQYLAGFKCVSSAERYQRADLTDLKKQVNLFHPLSKN